MQWVQTPGAASPFHSILSTPRKVEHSGSSYIRGPSRVGEGPGTCLVTEVTRSICCLPLYSHKALSPLQLHCSSHLHQQEGRAHSPFDRAGSRDSSGEATHREVTGQERVEPGLVAQLADRVLQALNCGGGVAGLNFTRSSCSQSLH